MIEIGFFTVEAELNDSPTARKIIQLLPITTKFETWGDEISFHVPIEAALDEYARETVEVGHIGFWPIEKTFCIFYGETPISTEHEILPASAVNIIGRILGDAKRLKKIKGERDIITVRPLEDIFN